MICVVDKNNIVVNIINGDEPKKDNERVYHEWNELHKQYTSNPPVEILKKYKLAEINAWTAAKITGGFVSYANGEAVTYDSDKDTQLTMQGIALNVNTEQFTKKYPDGCPVRGVKAGDTIKTVQYLTPAQVLQWCADLSIHIGTCKQEGWKKQTEVNAATTAEEIKKVIAELPVLEW